MDTTIRVRVVVEYAASGDRIVNVVGYVSGTADVAKLRSETRLVGVPVGRARRDLVDESKANGGEAPDVEVQLSMDEVVAGVAEGFLRLTMAGDAAKASDIEDAMRRIVHDPQGESRSVVLWDERALLRVRVFADLWKRGHFVALGSKFGVDFLVYEADPSSCHSFAMVVVKDYRSPFVTVDIVAHCRVAKMVKKQLVVASQQNAEIVYLSLDHAVLAAAQPERL